MVDQEDGNLERLYPRGIAELDDVEPTKLFALYSVADVAALDEFQRGREPEQLAADPVSSEFRQAYPNTTNALANNTSTYDDEVEDALVVDPVMEAIMQARSHDPSDRNLAAAQRARRSVIVFAMMAFAGDAGEGDHQNGSAAS